MAGVTPGFSEPNPYPYPPKPSPLDRGGGFTPQNPRGTQGVAQGYKGTKIPQGLTQRVISNSTISLQCTVIYHDIYYKVQKVTGTPLLLVTCFSLVQYVEMDQLIDQINKSSAECDEDKTDAIGVFTSKE